MPEVRPTPRCEDVASLAGSSYADEDVTGGFGHGGWHTRYFDDLSMNWVIENVRGAGRFLLGRVGALASAARRGVQSCECGGVLVGHVANIRTKLGVRSRAAAVAYATRQGLL